MTISAGPPVVSEIGQLVSRARELARARARTLLGITGPPGAGKSTVSAAIAADLEDLVRVVPMDGFHLAQAELVRLGRIARKGAPDTFDAAGYVALLARLRNPDRETVYAPVFRRDLEEPIACALAVPSEVPLVLTEGNYLLVTSSGWAGVRPLLDEVWYVEDDESARMQRLVRRHIQFGKPPDLAREWVLESDQRNAELVARTRHRADLIVSLETRSNDRWTASR